jgi:alpha-beta hydrolase superfamily lysophospholipase
MKTRPKLVKNLLYLSLLAFIFINVVAFFHAYKFTNFSEDPITKTKRPEELTAFDKIKTVVFGINNPKPVNKAKPSGDFEPIRLKSNKEIECWHIKTAGSNPSDSVKGTVLIFHGYSGEKSSMLDKSNEFNKLGYNTFLVDFMGSGGSEGYQTTLGFKEAEEVKTAFEYVKEQGEENIYLFGNSMGAVAIMKALHDYNLKTKGIIIECPFGSMYETTCARFRIMNAPTFPMAGLLVFWGGVQNNFWALGHNPTEYAKQITRPTLLLYGEQDQNISRQEIDEIYTNLKGEKTLSTYPLIGHENYFPKYKAEWLRDVNRFLQTN